MPRYDVLPTSEVPVRRRQLHPDPGSMPNRGLTVLMLKRIPVVWKLSGAFIIIIALTLITLAWFSNLSDDPASRDNWWIFLAIVLAAVLASGSTWLLVRRFVKRPVRRLEQGMSRLAEKEFDFRLPEDDRDEFGSLATSFNDMASMLEAFVTELKKTRDYVRGILEGSADIIITFNPSGKIQTINAGAENALGYQQLEVIGKPIDIFFADPAAKDEAMGKLKQLDNVVNYEAQFLTKAGDVRDVLLTLSHLRNPAGAIIGAIGISKDITEEKRLQAELIQSQRFAAIGQVFTGIQHSMKNMLNALKGGAYMVKTGLAIDDRKMLAEGWEIVQQGITRLTDMSLDMLKYVKDFKPKLEPVDLSSILSDITHVIKQTAEDKGVAVQLRPPTEMPKVLCDAGMVHSAVMDIVSNALDACLWKDYQEGETPAVVMSAYLTEDREEAVIEVKDNGCGMTQKVKENIFTPFFSTKSKAGTGLGLSITSRMITVHDGRIEVESEPNQGAVFRIILPIDGTGRKKENIDGKEGSSS